LWASFIIVVGPYTPRSDQAEYSSAGHRWADGLGLTHPGGTIYVHTHPPGYALFLGIIYATGGGDAAVRWVQLAMALATLTLAAAMARRFFGDAVHRAALIAGGAYLPTAFYVSQLLSEILFTFLLVVGVYLLVVGAARERAAWLHLLAGVAFGLAGLTRGVALAVAVAVAVTVLTISGVPRLRRWGRVAVFGVGVVAAVAPWSLHVYRTTGRAVLVDTKSAEVLYRGNNPGTPLHHAWDIIDGLAKCMIPASTVGVADRYDRSRIYTRAAFRYMADHPFLTALRFGSKFADMWEAERLFIGDYRAGFLTNALEPLVRVYIFAEIAASAAALAAFWVAVALMPGSRWRRLTLAVVWCTAAAYAITIAHPRYNYPLMVLGAPALGYFFAEVIPRLRKKDYAPRRLVPAGAAVVFLVVVWARMVWLYVAYGS
jgi:hypothetical protein